jgi:adenosine deaminase
MGNGDWKNFTHRTLRGVTFMCENTNVGMFSSQPPEPCGDQLLAVIDIRRLPKVLLHEHLDGGLRPQTMIELSRVAGYTDLPTHDPTDLASWFHRGAQKGSLPEYLEGFRHTCALMQSKDALERVAYEFIEDMKNDGVIYAEARFAPVLHIQEHLNQDEVVAAVIAGLRRGEEDFGVKWGLIICALRDRQDSLEAAELAIRCREQGVVGFDLAGAEAGFPPKKHIDAFHAIQRANFNITIHAGEAFGPESIWQAIQYCGAHRLGHGTRIVDEITVNPDGTLELGSLARFVLDHRTPLEMCLSSNLHTGACDNLSNHPFGILFRNHFRICINTDDRLMSDTTMTKETELATRLFNLSLADLERLTLNAMKSAFAPFETRYQLISDIIRPAYAGLRVPVQS